MRWSSRGDSHCGTAQFSLRPTGGLWSRSGSYGSWQSASPARGLGNTRNSRSGVRQFLLALGISIKTPQSPINGPKLARFVVSGGVPSMVQKIVWPGGWACVCRRRFGGRVQSLLAICGERLSTIEHVSHDDCCKSDSILPGAVTGDHVVLVILWNLSMLHISCGTSTSKESR